MYRKKRIILLAHCILNQNSVIRGWERAKGAFNEILKIIIENDIGIIQLPCPEFSFLGEGRPPMTKEEYDQLDYRITCRELAIPIIKQIKQYICNDYSIIGLIGIGESPSCDTLGKKGIFIEEFISLVEEEGLILKYFDIPESYIEGKSDETVDRLKTFIKIQLDYLN